MANSREWIPVRWPAGPLEAARAKVPAGQAQSVFDRWRDPASLEVLKGTPFNCLVVWWAAGAAQDADQQRAVRPLIERAKAQGLAVVGQIAGDPGAALPGAGVLDGLIVEKAPTGWTAGGLTLIASVKSDGLDQATPTEILALADAAWPRVQVQERHHGADAEGGPTGAPWIDSNGWAIQLVSVKLPDRRIWVLAEPPKDTVLRTEAYVLAVADAQANGAHWPVLLDAQLRAALLDGKSEALGTWKRIGDTVRFLEDRHQTPGNPSAYLGVCSDFVGDNVFLANEVLNLSSRRLLPCRILDQSKLSAKDLAGLKAVLWVNEKAPEGNRREILQHFVEAGGTLIVPASVAHMTDGLKPAARDDQGYAIYPEGQGRIAVARQPWSDPFLLARDAHLVMGRKNDLVRMWNAQTSVVRLNEQNGRGTAQIVNYAGRRFGDAISLYVARPYRTAEYCSLDQAARQLEVKQREGGVEVNVPPFSVYARIEFGG